MNQMLRVPPPSATLDIDVLRSVVAIAEAGSIAAAAARVARTPAAVSMQVKKLEDMLGRALFERSHQGMRPTAEGERLLDYARRMIELNRSAMQAFSAPELAGTVRIGLIDSFGGLRLAEVLAGFARSHPRVTVEVSMGRTVEHVPALDAGRFDLIMLTPGTGTGNGIIDLRDDDIVLREEPLAWIAREGGRAARMRPIPLAVANEGCAWRKLATEGVRSARLDARIAYVSDFDTGQLAAAQADLAVAPLPRSYLGPGLVELGPREGFPPLGLCRIALRLGENASGAARVLAAGIAESFGRRLPG
jgi:DNA-binding transcriptional LysR family regulator